MPSGIGGNPTRTARKTPHPSMFRSPRAIGERERIMGGDLDSGGNQRTAYRTVSWSTTTATMAGALTLTVASDYYQFQDPGGAARTITLPAVGSSDGLDFVIVNTADGEENITVANAGATTIALIGPGMQASLYCDGATWFAAVSSATGRITEAIRTLTMTGDVVLTSWSAPVQFLAPGGSSRNVDLPAVTGLFGVEFVILHNDGASTITVRLTGAGATVATVETAEVARVYCNGVTWLGGVTKTT